VKVHHRKLRKTKRGQRSQVFDLQKRKAMDLRQHRNKKSKQKRIKKIRNLKMRAQSKINKRKVKTNLVINKTRKSLKLQNKPNYHKARLQASQLERVYPKPLQFKKV
jgi:hypothetical protein